jgi:hypothetical protein
MFTFFVSCSSLTFSVTTNMFIYLNYGCRILKLFLPQTRLEKIYCFFSKFLTLKRKNCGTYRTCISQVSVCFFSSLFVIDFYSSPKCFRYVGRLFVKATGRPMDILPKLRRMADFSEDDDVELYEVSLFLSVCHIISGSLPCLYFSP